MIHNLITVFIFWCVSCTFKLSSFNCKNVKSSMQDVRLLCDKSDIVFLQETWLSLQELPSLSTIHSDFYGRGISSMIDSDGVRVGRPFGSLAVLWRKTFGTVLTIESLDDNRLMLCRLMHGNTTTTLVNVYLTCDNGSNIDEFSFYLSQIDSVLTCDVQAGGIGDFNSNITSIHHRFGSELKSFCASENLTISDRLLCKGDSSTFFNEAHNSVGWLDHVVSTSYFHSNIDDM